MAKEPFVARLSCIWIGGFCMWLLKGCRGRLSDMFSENLNDRNFWIGYIITMLMLVAGIILAMVNHLVGATQDTAS